MRSAGRTAAAAATLKERRPDGGNRRGAWKAAVQTMPSMKKSTTAAPKGKARRTAPPGFDAALGLLHAKHPSLHEEHEDIAQEAAVLAFEKSPRDPDAYARECADRIAKSRGAVQARRAFVPLDDAPGDAAGLGAEQARRRRKRGRPAAERHDDEAELRAEVVAECQRRWHKLTGSEWTEELRKDTRMRVEWICSDALDVQAARALFEAAKGAIERLNAAQRWGADVDSSVLRWMRTNVRRMSLGFPLVPENADRNVDERAALVELLDGGLRPNFAYLGRRGEPAEFALVYFLCGYWTPLGRDEVKLRLPSVPDTIRAETKRMFDQRKRHGRGAFARTVASLAPLLSEAPPAPGTVLTEKHDTK